MEQYTIPNLVKAIDVLRLISQHPQGLNAVAIEKQTLVPRTTVFRILRTLLSVGWVRKDNDRYYAGLGLVEIGLNAINKLEIRQLAAPILQELTAETEFTSHLAIPSGTQSMIVEVCDSPHPLRVASRPGSRLSMHCSSTGKIFLSYLYADQLATHLGTKALPALTDNVVASARPTDGVLLVLYVQSMVRVIPDPRAQHSVESFGQLHVLLVILLHGTPCSGVSLHAVQP